MSKPNRWNGPGDVKNPTASHRTSPRSSATITAAARRGSVEERWRSATSADVKYARNRKIPDHHHPDCEWRGDRQPNPNALASREVGSPQSQPQVGQNDHVNRKA